MSNQAQVDFEVIASGILSLLSVRPDRDEMAAKWVMLLHKAMAKTESLLSSDRALFQAYMAVARRLKDGDPKVSEVLAALRKATVGPTGQIESLMETYRVGGAAERRHRFGRARCRLR